MREQIEGSEFWVEFGTSREGVMAALYKGRGKAGVQLFDRNKPILTVDTKDLNLQDPNSVYKRAMNLLQWQPAVRPSITAQQSQQGKQVIGAYKMAQARELALKTAVNYMFKGIENPAKFQNVTKIFHINANDPASRDITISPTGQATMSGDALAKKESITPKQLWVEFGTIGDNRMASLYKSTEPDMFNNKKPVISFGLDDLNAGKSVIDYKEKALKALGYRPGTPEANMLSQAISYMLGGMANPDKYWGMVREFHITGNPATRDISIDDTGKMEFHNDTPTEPIGVPLKPGWKGKKHKGESIEDLAKRKESLKKKADKLISGLHDLMELNGYPPPNDPNAGMMGMQQPAPVDVGTGLPIQKKNLDILGSMDISSDPDETEDVESAISADTTNQAIIVFERFNPVTRENLRGLKEFCDIARREGGDGFIFISQVFAEDESPELLSYEEVVELLEEVKKEKNIKAQLIGDPNIETLTDVANYLASDGYQSLVICTTADKLGEYQNELTRKNNMPTESGTFMFEPIEMRKIDALGTSEMKELNNAALDGDFGVFLKHIGTGDIDLAKKMYNKLRKQAM